MAKNMNITEKEIRKIAFIRMMLSTLWSVEEKDDRLVNINNKILREMLEVMY